MDRPFHIGGAASEKPGQGTIRRHSSLKYMETGTRNAGAAIGSACLYFRWKPSKAQVNLLHGTRRQIIMPQSPGYPSRKAGDPDIVYEPFAHARPEDGFFFMALLPIFFSDKSEAAKVPKNLLFGEVRLLPKPWEWRPLWGKCLLEGPIGPEAAPHIPMMGALERKLPMYGAMASYAARPCL